MKPFLKVLGLNMLAGLIFVVAVTYIVNGELANPLAYLNFLLVNCLIPGAISAFLVKSFLLEK